ncbi:Acetyl-coenzyme A synthetase 2-like, mitochondrial [Strongyloides ratti]|uniref:Acetyl-coenzyme A synthetase n=1 Tax=Strongyloides ratti TaxID=34506 RepID=A0A090MXM6_STRRB|nr:Acetyl-coenzyme A synthetase 2-like, mitochondrial [Strongyloides ratti]CEF65699.1 Acetyl-coenzyme A synthetase 2-like, mitochondrial [Strongyloides ratti]
MSDCKVKFDLDGSKGNNLFPPPSSLSASAHIKNIQTYHERYRSSLNESDKFWRNVASELYFEKMTDNGLEWNFNREKGRIFVNFMKGSRTNIAYNCLERNINRGLGNKIAFKFEGNEPGDEDSITYKELLEKVIAFSAVLRSKGVKKGDVVAIYLPMSFELPIAMLACARIGAIHSIVFAGFSSESLANRIIHCKSKILITADAFYRSNKLIDLRALAVTAVKICEKSNYKIDSMIVVNHSDKITIPNGAPQPSTSAGPLDIECSWDSELKQAYGIESPVEWMDSEDPSFILYTSGSTGSPKGIVHTTAGYMTYAYYTCKITFDSQDDDMYWCTADCGWITGHSYVVYGPLMNGMSSIIFEGIPTYPDAGRMWNIVEKYGVTKLYTAPTAVRCLMGFGNEIVKKYNRSSLKIIGSVGEPINPSAWEWLYYVVGEKRAAVVDTYWQTETGGHVIVPVPGAVPTKPGSATLPFFGVVPCILDNDGALMEGPGEGNLCFSQPWPGISRSCWDDHERWEKTYFSSFKGYYFTGDGCRRDEDGYHWVTGRVDDLMNVSGHLLSTAEIESALVEHPGVSEAAVVAAPHNIKGNFPYAFVTMLEGTKLTPTIVNELKLTVRRKIGAIAVPDVVQEAPGLPKTRSGKITRRILRKIAEGDVNADFGDTTTLVDESVITKLINNRPESKTG